jgi:hypothetical protein
VLKAWKDISVASTSGGSSTTNCSSEDNNCSSKFTLSSAKDLTTAARIRKLEILSKSRLPAGGCKSSKPVEESINVESFVGNFSPEEEEESYKMLISADIYDLGLILLECALGGLDMFSEEDLPCGRAAATSLDGLPFKTSHGAPCCCLLHCSKRNSLKKPSQKKCTGT